VCGTIAPVEWMSGRVRAFAPAAVTVLCAALVIGAWAALHLQGLRLGFMSDDYQWWQHARLAVADPSLLIASFGGYRPANTWSLAVDYLLYGVNPPGYHATSLLLHLACGLTLWALLARLGMARVPSAGLSALWLCSPYTYEVSQTVCQRFEMIILLCWLGMALSWPAAGERWSPRRAAIVVLLSGLTMMAKETWIVLPGFVFLFELSIRRTRFAEAVKSSIIAAVPVAAYLAIYTFLPAIAFGSFFGAGLAGVLKIPHSWAAFLGIAEFAPSGWRFGLAEGASVLMMAGLGWLGLRGPNRLIVTGFALFFLPYVPILPVGWLTSRYTTIPYAGFLMALAGGIVELSTRVPQRHRRFLAVAAAVLWAVLAVSGISCLLGDIADYRLHAEFHQPLLGEARAFAPRLPDADLIVSVRQERARPLEWLAERSVGLPKVYFVRGPDPYTLADWGALFGYVDDPRGGPYFVEANPSDSGSYAVVAHTQGAFVPLPARGRTVAEEVRIWQELGDPAKVYRRRTLK